MAASLLTKAEGMKVDLNIPDITWIVIAIIIKAPFDHPSSRPEKNIRRRWMGGIRQELENRRDHLICRVK